MPVGAHRIGNACLTLQFDKFLTEFDQTYIISPLDGTRLDAVFRKYGINTDNFVYVADQEIINKHPQASNWNLHADYRGPWLFQQAIKLAMIDDLSHDIVFLQDADTFCTQRYDIVVDGRLQLWHLPNVSHAPGYYEGFRNITGLERQTPHCFVCDMMPVFNNDWINLRELVEQRFDTHWLDSIIDNTPWDYVANVKWVSEYELLGNWALAQNSKVDLVVQNRFEFKNLEQIVYRDFPVGFNVISDKNPQMNLLRFDFASDIVDNYEAVFGRLRHLL
jgi:hypothetical protein